MIYYVRGKKYEINDTIHLIFSVKFKKLTFGSIRFEGPKKILIAQKNAESGPITWKINLVGIFSIVTKF